MLDQLKNDMLKIKDWCLKHKKISVALAIVLALVIGSGFVLENRFDNDDDNENFHEFRNNEDATGNNFSKGDNFGDGGGPGDRANLNPQLALIYLLIVLGVGAIVGIVVFLYISSKKKKVKPLPVLYNPIKNNDKEVE